jgi:diketogulonate reductase-like aldo/keto reductase
MSSMATVERVRELPDGNVMPVLGLGVWQTPNGPECVRAVRWALEVGYRHIDTAQAYGNEESVGKAIRESKVAREELFITTKFHPSSRDPVIEAERSLRRLGIDHVDLYLVHWPGGGPTWAWPGMETAKTTGYARSIGVSNFGANELRQLLAWCSIPPVVDQVNANPFAYRRALLQACGRLNVVPEAYSPLGTGRHLGDNTVVGIAERVGRTPAQVLIRWCLQRGLVVIPKSLHRLRIQENIQVFDFELSEEDIAVLDALDTTNWTDRALEHPWW